MNMKRLSMFILLVILIITACDGAQPAEMISLEEPISPIEDSPSEESEILDEEVPAQVPDLSNLSGSQTVINRGNADTLVQIDYLGKGNINSIAWSPLGSPIALATTTGIYLIDAQTYQEQHFSQTAAGHVAFSLDGILLASTEGPRVILRDAQSGRERLVLEGHADQVYHIAFSPIENLLATASQDETVKLWDLGSGDELKTLKGTGTFVYYVAFSPDGKTLISVAYDQQIIMWDVESGAALPVDSEISGSTLAVSLIGETIAAGGYVDPLTLYDYDGQVSLPLDETPKPVIDLAFSPDGKVLASATSIPDEMDMNTTVRLWDITNGELLSTLDAEGGYNHQLLFSPDGAQLAAAALDKVTLWDVESGQKMATLTDQTNDREKEGYGTGGLDDFAWSPDGKTLALATDRSVNLVNLETGAEIELNIDGLEPQIGHIITFSPDGNLLAVSRHEYGGKKGRVEIWDTKSNALMMTLDDFDEHIVFGIAFSPNGKMLATGWGNSWGFPPGGVKLWDVSTGDLIKEFTYEGLATIYNLAVNHEGNLLATISGRGVVDIWDINTGDAVQNFQGTSGYGFAVAFSPDGNLLAAGGGASDGHGYDYEEAELGLFDVSTGELVYQLEGHQAIIRSLVFSTGGDVLASASWDGTVRLWDVETGQQFSELDVPGATSVGFSPDGTLLATAGYQDVLRLWGTPESDVSFPHNLAGETNTLQPIALGEDFTPGRWSGDGRYYYYSEQGPMDEPGSNQAYQTLTFLDTYTGETCVSVGGMVSFSYNVWIEAMLPEHLFSYDRTLWMNDNRLLYLSKDGELFALTPCSDAIENWTDSLPEPVTAFHYGTNYDHSQMLLEGESGTWLFTYSTGASVKVDLPASYPDEATRFTWSPWEEKLVSSRVDQGERIILESIDPVSGVAELIAEFPVITEGSGWGHSVSPGVGWTANDQILLHYLDNWHEQLKLIDLISQPVKITDVFIDLFGIDSPSLDHALSEFGEIDATGRENYYLILATGLSPDGQLYLYSGETGLVETYSFDPPKLLVFPNGDITFADRFGEIPIGEEPYQVIHIDTDKEPFNLEIIGRIPGQSPWGKVVMIPGRDQLLIAKDQGVSLVDLESGEILKLWELENQAQYDNFSLHPSPDGKTVIIFAMQNEENNEWEGHTRAIYWLNLDG